MSETSRFAIGAGRARPPHQPHELACPQCGASIALPDERGRVVVCAHCRCEIELSPEQSRALGVVGDAPAGFRLEVGAPFEWHGVRYQVVGRVARADVGEPDSLTYGYLLYNPTHPSLWLSCYDDSWAISRRTRVMPTESPWEVKPGGALITYDGATWHCEEIGASEIVYVDGALPWLARVGDRARHAEFTGEGGQTYEAEQNPTGELEYGRGRNLTAAEIAQATGGAVEVATRPALGEAEKKLRWRAVAIIWMVFGLVSLATGFVLSFATSPLASGKLSAKGGEVGPFKVEKANTVVDIEIRQPFRKDGWSFIEGEVLDEDENHLFGFGEELWAESGYDEGQWHEEKNDYELSVTIPEPGEYYLGFTAQAGLQAQPAATPEPDEVGGEMRVIVERRAASTLPFWYAGAFGLLLGLVIFEIATGAGRRALSNMETD